MGEIDKNNDGYLISDDKTLLEIKRVKALLETTYWAQNRSGEAVVKSIENSLAFGLYYHNEQVGFARVITDFATTYFLCDVVIDETHRGKGLGKKLVKTVIEDDRLINLRGILATRDAHGLYQQYGFIKSGEVFMCRAWRV